MKHVSAAQVEAELGVSRSRAYQILRELPRVRTGKRGVRVSESAFRNWVMAHTEDPCSDANEAESFAVQAAKSITSKSARASDEACKRLTGKRPSSELERSSELPQIQITVPRTKPRSKSFSKSTCSTGDARGAQRGRSA